MKTANISNEPYSDIKNTILAQSTKLAVLNLEGKIIIYDLNSR
jgi:flagella basal body P-ring formation protein FlgA